MEHVISKDGTSIAYQRIGTGYPLVLIHGTTADHTRWGQSVTFTVNAFNRLNPALDSTLTLAVTGPRDYYYFDFQKITVAADAVNEYSFTWTIPDVAGTYVVEASLVPSILTAYDTAWLETA